MAVCDGDDNDDDDDDDDDDSDGGVIVVVVAAAACLVTLKSPPTLVGARRARTFAGATTLHVGVYKRRAFIARARARA